MAIEHIVIIVKENHTLDNYFGTLPGVDGQQLAPEDRNEPGPEVIADSLVLRPLRFVHVSSAPVWNCHATGARVQPQSGPSRKDSKSLSM